MVTHRERIARVLRGEPVDRTAHGEFFLAEEFVRQFSGFDAVRPARLEHQHYAAVVEALDLDIAAVSLSAGWGALEQPDEDRALESLTRWRDESDRFVFALIDGPFSAAVKARGFNMLMHYVRGAPHVARDLFRRGADDARVTAQAVRDAGAAGVVLGEDIAYGSSTYLSPPDLRELYLPALDSAAREIHNLGVAVFFHSDGNLNAILKDLGQCALDGIHSLEPESGMDVAQARECVGGRTTLWGNLGYEFLSVERTEQQAADAVRAIESANDGRGGLVVGSSSGLVQGLNIETVRRVHRAGR
ncbi:MAG: uroporphyrinogen decarboxylase family protein [Chloroflexi bacterium]|nr:uroporphyrinogen decarboxylase family protein [Chloroflexota bacterium]